MGTLQNQYKQPTTIPSTLSGDLEIIPVRVRDVILDNSHPEFQKYGQVDCIGAIKYTLIDRQIDFSDPKTLPIAFPASNHTRVLPLRNEIVFIIRGPRGDKKLEKVDYYLPSLRLFNDINYSPFNDDTAPEDGPGDLFKESEETRPLNPFTGDVILEGRLGQSIRFTGQSYSNQEFTNNPLTVITNGHVDKDPANLYIEDINKDLSSIYIASDHIIPLDQSRDKYAGAEKRPTLAKEYKGNQIIINSGRLFFNSTEEDIQFATQNRFGVTAKSVHIDGVDQLGLDANKIYLGEKARQYELQPVILGNQLELFLSTLLSSLESLSTAITKAKTVDQKPIPTLNMEGPSLKAIVKSLQNQINPGGKDSLLKSKKVYTE